MLNRILSSQRLWRYVAVYLFYLAIAILITYPLVTVMSTRLAGDGTSDAYEYVRHIWWYRHALQTGQSLFFQSLLAYPDGIPSMYLWAVPLRTFPAWLFAFFVPLPAAFNLMLLLRLALNGAAMCWTAFQFTRNRGAALIAGAIYLAYPSMQGHLLGAHVDLLALWGFPLYIWSLFQLLNDAPSRKWRGIPVLAIVRSALLFVISLLGNFVLLVYMLFPITAMFVLWRLWQRDWRVIVYTGMAAVVGGALSLIFVLPAILELLNTPALREGGSVRYSADLLAAVSPSFFNPLYQNLGYNRQVLGINMIEGSGYLGIVAGLLALMGIWRAKAARWWLVLALIAWVFSLGPLLNINASPVTLTVGDEYTTYVPLPWALFQSLPVLNISRTPGRFNFVVGLCMAMMAAYGVASLPAFPVLKRLRDQRWAKFAVVVVLALMLFDYQSFFPLPTVRADIPDAIVALGQREDLRAVFDVPWENLLVAKEGLYLQTGHGLPLIAGQVTRQTPVNPAMLTILQQTLNPALLREAGADVVIVHRAGGYDADGTLFNRAQQQLGAPTYADERFAVFEVPTTDVQPSLVVYPPLGMTAFFDPEITYYLYTPQSGWFLAGMEYDTYSNINAVISVDNHEISQVVSPPNSPMYGTSVLSAPLPIPDRGYYTIRFRLVNPCPNFTPQYQICNTPFVTTTSGPVGFERDPYFQEDNFDHPVNFDHGVQISGALLVDNPLTRSIFLWWHFDEAVTDTSVRFIHVLNANGERVGGSDNSLGNLSAGHEWSESIPILSDSPLPPGEYRVYVGWYTYPDLVRFPIVAGGADQRAQDGLAYIGSFTVESP